MLDLRLGEQMLISAAGPAICNQLLSVRHGNKPIAPTPKRLSKTPITQSK